jgi:hypothetical protein
MVKSCNAWLLPLLVCINNYLKSVLLYKFLILVPFIRTFYVYVCKDVRIHGYFSKQQGAREQKSLGNGHKACRLKMFILMQIVLKHFCMIFVIYRG